MTIPKAFDEQWRAVPGPLSTPCYIWQRARKGKEAAFGGGYGCFKLKDKTVGAHRFAYERATGKKIPRGKQVMHLCHETRCVNPLHLQVGTNDENAAMRAAALRGTRRLSVDDVRAIRARCAAGEPQSSVAGDFALHQADVSNIVNRKYWRHVA